VQIHTVGHSTRSLEELIGLLRGHGIEALADIRSFPSSKRYPHFHKDVLLQQLPQAGIAYHWLGKALGGYRKKGDPNSPHVAIRSPGFRNYADHMASEEFRAGIDQLGGLASENTVAIMCAERLWWRCHRSLVSDYLAACRGCEVLHIVEAGKIEAHRLNHCARLAAGRLVYDVQDEQRNLF
jgi:uncharacterized protein (DUF488 family)